MSQVVIDAIEMAVGLGCLAAAAAGWRRRALRAGAAGLALAGVAAVAHASWSLLAY